MITRKEIIAYARAYGATVATVTAEDERVVRALDKAWAEIHERNPRVPRLVTFDLTPGRSSSCNSVGWDQPTPVLAVNLRPKGQDGPNISASDLLVELLHWAAHSAIPPTRASEGRYHQAAFKDAAEGLGLSVKLGTGGFDQVELATGTRHYYRNALAALDRALSRWEPTEQVKTDRAMRNGVVLSCQCDPPRRIRIRGREPDVSAILCEICGKHFAETG